ALQLLMGAAGDCEHPCWLVGRGEGLLGRIDLGAEAGGNCSICTVRVRDSYPRAQYLRLKSRCGAMKAIVAVAASLLTAAYHMLRPDPDHRAPGAAAPPPSPPPPRAPAP